MAFPNFLYYYWAVNIRVLLYWLGNDNDNTDTEWLNLEGASVNLTSLKAILCYKLPFTQPVSDFTSNLVVLHSFKIWNQLKRSCSLTDLSQATPITKNHMFAPSLIDDAFNGWSRRGMVSLSDLYIDSNFASFEQLVQRYHIPKSHFYRYLQLRIFAFSNLECFPSCPPSSLLDSFLIVNL